ncbi:hypothetical protein [Nocardioides pakistanensis]
MTLPATRKPRPSVAARRTGYVIAALVNAVLLYLVNVWPGWEELPFLTSETTEVLGWVNASMIAGIITNLVYVGRDTNRVRAAGDLVTTGIGLVAMVRMWQVFPFDFDLSGLDWAIVARVFLVIGIVGSAIAMVVRLVSLLSDTGSRR